MAATSVATGSSADRAGGNRTQGLFDMPHPPYGHENQARLYWDPVNEHFKNDDEANRMLSRPQRAPYMMNM